MAHRLTVAARRNQAARAAELETALANDGSGKLKRFVELVRRSGFSSNVSADKIIAFDETREVLDGRRLRVHQAGGDTRSGMRVFRAGVWFARREAFEALWQHGRRLIYGAVNAGNMGTEGQYGAFCLVAPNPASCKPEALAVFPADTAQTYTDAAAAVDAIAAPAEATRWEDRDALAVLARSQDVLVSDESEWPDVLCRPDRYLEAVIAPLPLSAIDEVRIRTVDRDRLEELELRQAGRLALSNTERNELGAFLAIGRWVAARDVLLSAY